MMDEPVDSECHCGIGEDSIPLAERLVRGDQRGALLVSRADELEQDARFSLVLGDVGARGDGRYGRALKTFGRTQLLILDDWGLSVLGPAERRDLLEILEDRHGRASTIITSQIPVEHWHDLISETSAQCAHRQEEAVVLTDEQPRYVARPTR